MTLRTIALCALLLGCGGTAAPAGMGPRDAGPDASRSVDAALPLSAADPCLSAGFHFDGKSDCDVVRCPELTCKCPGAGSETLTFEACVRGQGCVDRVDCQVACSTSARLSRMACQTRLTSPGAACSGDSDCSTGHCRQESAGKLCVDLLGCAEDAHCSTGFTCRVSPGALDAGVASALGSCSNGSQGSVCYEDAQCKYKLCSGNACAGGRVSDACKADEQCASGFCRTSTGNTSGYCVSGERGAGCSDDGDCGSGLHCSEGACYGSGIGQACDGSSDCESGLCIANVCRGGEPGSVCLEDAHCKAGVCSSGRCVSGGVLSPCAEAADCNSGLRCARQVCGDGSAGAPCSSDADCKVRACVRGTCRAGALGDICDAADDCESNRCADPAGVDPGECTSGAQGSRCVSPSNCTSASCSPQGTCN